MVSGGVEGMAWKDAGARDIYVGMLMGVAGAAFAACGRGCSARSVKRKAGEREIIGFRYH